MSTFTTNLNLEKPDYKTAGWNDEINGNFDIIDTAAGEGIVTSEIALTPVKIRKLTSTTPATMGTFLNVPHGETNSLKIISVSPFVRVSPKSYPEHYTYHAGYEFDYFIDDTNIVVRISATNSGNILSLPLIITIITTGA